MSRFRGMIGYAQNVETEQGSGEWIPDIVEKRHSGNVLKDFARYQSEDVTIPTLTITNKISVVANNYILDNTSKMRYVVWQSAKWEIVSFKFEHPRIILTLGGVYNGNSQTS